jgi:hypothetical protein
LDRKMLAPPVSLTADSQSPTRARSVSQPIREGVETNFSQHLHPSRSTVFRSQSSNSVIIPANISTPSNSAANPNAAKRSVKGGRARSSSLVTVTEVGGDEPENVVDRLGIGTNENAAWVNAPGESCLMFISYVV